MLNESVLVFKERILVFSIHILLLNDCLITDSYESNLIFAGGRFSQSLRTLPMRGPLVARISHGGSHAQRLDFVTFPSVAAACFWMDWDAIT